MYDVQIRGQGDDDLVLLYGVPLGAGSLEPIASSFEDDFRLVVPELNEGPADPAEALPALVETLEDEGVDRPMVLGHSFGSYRALQLGLHDEMDADRLALVGPLAGLPSDRRRDYERLIDDLESGDLEVVQTVLDHWFRPDYAEDNPDLRRLLQEWLQDLDADSVRRALVREMPGDNLDPRLGQLDIPVCLVAGTRDEATPPEWAEQISAHLHDSRLHVIRNAGHFPHFERPEVTLQILRGFAFE